MIPRTFALTLAAACSFSFASSLLAQGKLRIVVSVDWEGRDLNPENLEAMNAFRADYPEIPLQHFLNAAYYTKPGAKPKEVTEKIRSVLRPQDEHGLHIHAWRSLFSQSGVTFRTEPAFRGPLDLKACDPDCGHDVNLTAYSEEELRKVIRFSLKTLGAEGFQRPTSFRAGAWQADKKVLRALSSEGFTLDSSATDAEFLKERWGKSLLYPVVKKIWPSTLVTTQPYDIDLGSGLKIKEFPNNGCLADYTKGEVIAASFQKNADLLKANPQQDVYLSIGFHQETAKKFLPQLRDGLIAIKAAAVQQKIPLEFIVHPI